MANSASKVVLVSAILQCMVESLCNSYHRTGQVDYRKRDLVVQVFVRASHQVKDKH